MALRLSYDTAALRVCVDQALDGRIRGRIVSQRLSAPIVFSDVTDLILQAEGVMDAQKFPQAFQRIRTFAPGSGPDVPAAQTREEMTPQETVAAARGAQDTFLIHVDTRQNATWQGAVDWLDGSPKQNFESILELIKFVDQRYFHP